MPRNPDHVVRDTVDDDEVLRVDHGVRQQERPVRRDGDDADLGRADRLDVGRDGGCGLGPRRRVVGILGAVHGAVLDRRRLRQK